jgi:N-carbamoyl-L-amino-acid hydrolase
LVIYSKIVHCVHGISHNPKEFTAKSDLAAGANVLLDVVAKLIAAKKIIL